GRTEQSGRATPPQPVITGAAALDGFATHGVTSPNHSASSPQSRTSTESPTTQSDSSQTASPTPTPTSGTEPSASTSTSSTPPAPIDEKLATVNEFYQRMGSQQPQDALAMLAPGLAGDRPGDLVRAWSSMSQVEVKDVRMQSDGSVLAVVEMV